MKIEKVYKNSNFSPQISHFFSRSIVINIINNMRAQSLLLVNDFCNLNAKNESAEIAQISTIKVCLNSEKSEINDKI